MLPLEEVSPAIKIVLAGSDGRKEKARLLADLIRVAGNYRWVGIYDVLADEIAAIAWTGAPPAHLKFPKPKGLCGSAVSRRATVLVNDVAKDPRYLTTFSSTGSEMIVPVFSRAGHEVIGLVDVESDRTNAFGELDRKVLEGCAPILVSFWE